MAITRKSTSQVSAKRPLTPPANVLPPQGPHYLRTLLIAVAGALGVIVIIGVVLLANFFHGVSSACSQKVQGAKQQAQQETNELNGVSLFGSKPRVATELNDDCLDGDGSGTATGTYAVNDVSFTDANNEVLRALGGTELPLDQGKDEVSYSISSIDTTVTAASGKMYDFEFVLTTPFNCPATVDNGICETGNVVQAYNLQNAPINEIDISTHDSGASP